MSDELVVLLVAPAILSVADRLVRVSVYFFLFISLQF